MPPKPEAKNPDENGNHESGLDFDAILAYDTTKLVRVLDRRLGLTYYAVQAITIAYIVIIVFIIKKQYLDFEKAMGWITIKAMKPQMSQEGFSWDVFDRVTNPGEQGAIFIPTRVLVTKGQTQEDEYCESPVHKCTTDDDCDIGNELLQRKECVNNHCMRRQWCPAEDTTGQSGTTETHYLEYDHVQLWFTSYLHYHRFMLDVSTADESEPVHYPHRRANTYRLRDLVRMTNVEPEVVQENGAVLIVNALFDCELDNNDCELKVEAATVDSNFYYHIHNHVYFEDGVRKRDSYRMFGIRLVAFTTGFGKKTSLAQIVLQISSAISLLSLAEMVADFVLSNVIAERNHYYTQKVTEINE